jgi:hypothetical protein
MAPPLEAATTCGGAPAGGPYAMESRSAGCATATGAAVRMQPDKTSAAATVMIGIRNARATRTGTIP